MRPAPPRMRAGGEPSLAWRLHLRELTALYDAAMARKTAVATADGFYVNRLARSLVEDEEAAARAAIELDAGDIVVRERAARARVAERLATQRDVAARALAVCTHKFARLAAADAGRDALDEARFAADGRAKLATERDMTLIEMFRQDSRRRQMLNDMQGVHAAQVFLISDELRQRRNMAELEERALLGLLEASGRDGVARYWERDLDALVADAEHLKQSALGSAEAARRAEKLAAEMRKEQQRLIQKCTHSRNGKSVFGGAFPKKLCLVCKVKFDPTIGMLVPM